MDASELWCWRRLLRVPWTARISSQSILKEISPEYSLEGLMLKLKLQYFGHLMQSTDALEKTLTFVVFCKHTQRRKNLSHPRTRFQLRSNQPILKEISLEYILEGLILQLMHQYFGHLIQRTDSLEKTLMLGKIEGRRRRGRQRMRWLDGITDSMDMSLLQGGTGDFP